MPDTLQGANLLGSAGTDHRVRALQELVRVLKENATRSAEESRAKSSYLANMSHELRTPINAIIGYTEMLAEEAAESGLSLEPDLRKVTAAGRQLVELVNDILDLSKIEIGQLPIVLEDVDLAQVVDEVRAAIAPMVSRNNNTFSARIVPGARLVRGDHMRIRQILVNLLSNAFKFTQGGNVTLSIERSGPMRDSWIALRVRDTGQGMGPEELKRVFDEYQQGSSRSDLPGTGLGLTISRKLSELMGGRLDAESEIGVGSEFSLILPPAQRREAEVPARSTIALNERLSGMCLLLVDSEPSGITLARYLERAGLRVELLADVESARLAAQAKQPSIAILDAELPGTWGVAEELVARGVKVVVISLRDEDVEPALQRGVTAFLVRPVERKLVLATLERCLDE
ncbi:MAG TPA: response regulator [Deltaproteobacteria bacterium]|nr:response regulator [Deltaproteobacteria bacterium]